MISACIVFNAADVTLENNEKYKQTKISHVHFHIGEYRDKHSRYYNRQE